MIQLASEPMASRLNWRPSPSEGKGDPLQPPRAPNRHAWPFISQYAEKPTAQQQARKSSHEHGS